MKKILLVDDDPDVIEIVTFKLTWNGHQVVSASEDSEVLKKIEETRPALILLDLHIPKTGGG